MREFDGWGCGPPSGLGTEAKQFHEGVKEALQPTLVSHALLHHLLLAGVLRCLLNTVRLVRKYKSVTYSKMAIMQI